ncbi:restriction endonuclease subunit S [Flavobacterium lindanitolerans]|nr:restriction endonuclease subunit S [Flavobacterium lindanitolerans]MDQ7961460.1 restriction endonuclease subunit S [Flavobacterium lindanitolerans]
MSFYFDNFLKQITAGSTITHLYQKDFIHFNFILPSLPEQKAIAEVLSGTDTWIESLEKLIVKKQLIKQGAMQKLLTPKEDWETKKLGEIINVFRGGSPRPIQNFITNTSNGINWIKIGDTSPKGKYINNTEEKIIPAGEKYSRLVNSGDFLLSNSMSFGRPYILKIDGCIHDGWLVLQNYHSHFETEFLYYLLTSKLIIDQYKSKAAGSGVLNLNKELVKSVYLQYPKIKEQTRIATILSDMDTEIENLEQKLTKAQQIKQGLMQELLTGRIRLV